MPRLSHPKITKGHAASFLVHLYLQEPQFRRELCEVRRHHSEVLAQLVLKEVEFLANCKKAFTTEEYHKIIHCNYESITGQNNGPALPKHLARQLEQLKKIYLELGPYFDNLKRLASRWKLEAPWAGPMLYLYDKHDYLKELGMPDAIDVPLDQMDLLYPWPPPVEPLEIKVSAWAFVFYGRKQIQIRIARKLKDYEEGLKAVGLKENPSALENHAKWWFEHYIKGKTYRELAEQFPQTEEETIKRKVWEFSKLVGIRNR